MSAIEEVSESAEKAIVGGIVVYFVVLLYSYISGDDIARTATEGVFGILAIGIGGILLYETPRELSAIQVGAVSLVIGGIAQLGWILTGEPLVELVATIGIFLGVGLYIYAAWITD